MRTPQDPKQTAGDAVAESNRRFADAAGRGDARAMASLYTDDADFLPPNAEPLKGQAAIERFWQGGISMGIRGLEQESLRLEEADGLACEIGRYTLSFEPEGDAHVTELARFVLVHKRQPDGSWLRTVEIFNWPSHPSPDERMEVRR
jgi:uncharacterized protein (TIGR02246 family)